MKKVFFFLMAPIMLCAYMGVHAQTATTKIAAAEEATPANVLKWTKEVLPKLEPLVSKLEKIKAANTGKVHTDAIKLLATVSQLKEINAKGSRLKAAEAKKYFNLIAATVNTFFIECQSQNNGVCCIDCHNHGILGVWCFANCFVWKFPGLD
jgi:hypothetical protein